MPPRPQARRPRTSPRGLARSLKQRKESRRPQSSRREDHASAQCRHGQSKDQNQSHTATKTHPTPPPGHGRQTTPARTTDRTPGRPPTPTPPPPPPPRKKKP